MGPSLLPPPGTPAAVGLAMIAEGERMLCVLRKALAARVRFMGMVIFESFVLALANAWFCLSWLFHWHEFGALVWVSCALGSAAGCALASRAVANEVARWLTVAWVGWRTALWLRDMRRVFRQGK